MPIISIVPVQAGLVGVKPSLAYIHTTDTVGEVTAVGYLNKAVEMGTNFTLPCLASVSTLSSPSATPDVGWFEVKHVGGNWSLDSAANTGLALPNGQILVGDASGLAQPVTPSGIVAMTNAGVFSIPLTSAQMLIGNGSNVAQARALTGVIAISNTGVTTFASSVNPTAVIKLLQQYTTAGGTAVENFSAPGTVAATDKVFCQIINNGSNNVTILEAIISTDGNLAVTFSADPQNNCVFSAQVVRPVP